MEAGRAIRIVYSMVLWVICLYLLESCERITVIDQSGKMMRMMMMAEVLLM